jgi:tight adherence protein C
MNATVFALVAAAAVFAAVLALAVFVVQAFLSRERRQIQRRLAEETAAAADEFGAAGERPVLQELARRGQALGQLLDTQGETNRLFVQAGWRDAQSRLLFYVMQALVPLVLLGLVFLGWLFGEGKLFRVPLVFMMALLAVLAGMLIPIRVLRALAKARQRRIQNEVPLFVHMLVMLFDAGLSTRQAFSNLVREGSGVLPELGGEVQLALRQIEAGADSAEVLRNLGEALEVGDLNTILGVLRQIDRYGGEIREPLLDALKVIEERMALDLREKVNLMSGRMNVIMVAFFFPALLMFVAGPAFTAIIKAFAGLAKQ